LVIAMTMPISTKTTIAICIQIHVGDICADRLAGPGGAALRAGP
jgi:hypothetical protein